MKELKVPEVVVGGLGLGNFGIGLRFWNS